MATTEAIFQAKFIRKVRHMLPGCIILKNDPNYLQGILDLIILFEDKWALVEAKESRDAPHRPNQDYYTDLCNRMSYASFVYPENEEQVLYELQQTFRSRRRSRLPRG